MVGLGSVEGISVVSGQQVYSQRCEIAGLGRATEHNGDNRMVGGGAFQPYMPDKDSLQGWVGSVSSTRDGSVPGLHVAQEALLTPREEKEEYVAEAQFVEERGNALARKDRKATAKPSSTKTRPDRRGK